MGQESNKKLLRLLLIAACTLIVVCIVYLVIHLSPHLRWIGQVIKAILIPLFISLVLAYLLNPIVNILNNRNVPRGIAVFIIYFSFSLLVVVFSTQAVPILLTQFKDLGEHIPVLIGTYQSWLNEINTHKYDLPDSIRLSIDQALMNSEKRTSAFFTGILNGAGSFLSKMIHFLVIPFLVFYLLKDMKAIQKGILLLIPRGQRKEFAKVIAEIDTALGNYIVGQLTVGFAVGTMAYIGYWILDMPYAIILAIIIMVTNIIPYFGPFIGAIPSILVALTISLKLTLLVIVINLVIQILEGNVLSPLIMGKRLHLHPILIIFALLIGGEIAGLVGLIFAVPVVAVIRVILSRVIVHMVKH